MSHSTHLAAQVLRTRQPIVMDIRSPAVTDQLAPDDLHCSLIAHLQPQSGIILPLLARDQMIGTIGLYTTRAPRRYRTEDQAVLEELARRVASALEKAWLYQEAQEAIREREAFLAVASHEVRNPLTTLLGHAQLLRRRLAHEAARARDLTDTDTIIAQAQRVNQLLSDLLDASNVTSGQLTIQAEPLELVALVAQLVAELSPSAPTHTLTYTAHRGPLVIVGDAGRLQQVLHNLIRNAMKYSPAGSTVAVATDRAGSRARLTVSDAGVGIPAAELPHLFKRFYRVTRASGEQISGSGIGLYVVKDIVARHGGVIDVQSTEGVGSTFTVYLPLALPPGPPA
jgi:signal transduction histidine kinase